MTISLSVKPACCQMKKLKLMLLNVMLRRTVLQLLGLLAILYKLHISFLFGGYFLVMQLRVVVYRTGLSLSFVCYKKCKVFASNRLSVSVS